MKIVTRLLLTFTVMSMSVTFTCTLHEQTIYDADCIGLRNMMEASFGWPIGVAGWNTSRT